MMSERRLGWIVRGGSVLIRLLASTWRIRADGHAAVEAVRRERRVVFVFWHGEMLPLLWWHRGQGVAIMISDHGDGEIIARIIKRFGYDTVRGSSSRGGNRALIGAMRELAGGHDVGITPDGPRGPAHVFAPGAAVASYKAGAPIVAVRASISSAWRLKSWDSFLIPKPFARITVSYSVPTPVIADSPRGAAEQAPRLQALLESTAAT